MSMTARPSPSQAGASFGVARILADDEGRRRGVEMRLHFP